MQSYDPNMAGSGNVHKSGSTQPRPAGSEGSTPGGGGSTKVVGPAGPPVVVKTGAENNG